MPLAVQAKLAKRMETEMSAFASEKQMASSMSQTLGLDKQTVKSIWRRKEQVLKQQSEQNFSLKPQKHRFGRAGKGGVARKRRQGRGLRLSGAGRKSEFAGVRLL